jgi:hypothetical protein
MSKEVVSLSPMPTCTSDVSCNASRCIYRRSTINHLLLRYGADGLVVEWGS